MSSNLEFKVKLDNSDFKKGVEQNLAAIKALGKEKASIVIDLQKEQLQSDFQKIKEDFNQLSQTGIRPITFTVDKQKLEESIAEVQASLKGLSDDKQAAQIKLDLEKKQLEGSILEVKQKLLQLGNEKITPEIKLQKTEAKQALLVLSADLKKLEETKTNPEIEIKQQNAKAALTGLQTDLKKLEATKTKTEIEIQKEKAIADLAEVKSNLSKLDKVKLDIEIDKSKIGNLISEIKTGIGREIGSQLTQGLAQIPGAIARTTLEFEKLKTALKTTLGSQSEADKAFAFIQEFAAATPFQVSQITDSFVKLQNRGIAPTRELLTQLGDLASSNNKSLDQVVEAILDATTGENERLKEFGITASLSLAVVWKTSVEGLPMSTLGKY